MQPPNRKPTNTAPASTMIRAPITRPLSKYQYTIGTSTDYRLYARVLFDGY